MTGSRTPGVIVAFLSAIVLGLVVGVALPTAAEEADPAETEVEADAQRPTVTPSVGAAEPGEQVDILGEGWPTMRQVWVELCGNRALDGSGDCDLRHARNVTSDSRGVISTRLRIATPPSPCPCVIQVTALADGEVVAVPFEVVGAETGTPQRQHGPEREVLRIEEVSIDGRGPWIGWFGGSPERTLTLTVFHSGRQPVVNETVAVRLGRDAEGGAPVPTAQIGRVEPGERFTYETTVTLPALAMGRYVVDGELVLFGEPEGFTVTTTHQPWALYLLVLLLAGLLLWWWRRRAGRDDGEQPVDEGPPARFPPAQAEEPASVAGHEQTTAAPRVGASTEADRGRGEGPATPARTAEGRTLDADREPEAVPADAGLPGGTVGGDGRLWVARPAHRGDGDST